MTQPNENRPFAASVRSAFAWLFRRRHYAVTTEAPVAPQKLKPIAKIVAGVRRDPATPAD